MIGFVLATALVFSTTEPPTPLPVDPPRPEQVMAVPPALLAQFQQFSNGRSGNRAQRVDQLVEFLFKPEGLGMTYQHDATYTVAQAYQTRTANCLTFTLLTVALARELGLEAFGQQVDKSGTWHREGNTIYRTLHVNAGIRLAPRRLTVDVAWDQVITGTPPDRISDTRLLAHYYNNRAVELLDAGGVEAARRHAERSLSLDPEFATTWSNTGVLLLRAGEKRLAERDYLQALALEPTHVGALINLSAYYHRIGAPARASPYAKRLQALQQRDPIHQFMVALDFEKSGEFRQAVTHYRRAIRLYDREYHFHSGLARAYAKLGDNRRAERALERARQLAEIATARPGSNEAGVIMLPRNMIYERTRRRND